MAVYDAHDHNPNRAPAFWGGHDTGVSCAVHAAWSLWMLGYPDRADARMRDALEWARAAEHPFTLAYACHFAATFHECRRDTEAARALADEATWHSTEHGFELLASLGSVHRGWLGGDVAAIRSGVDAYRATGSRFGLPTYLGLLAEAQEKAGQWDEGLAVLANSRAIADETGAHYWDAELERLRGALLLRRGRDTSESSDPEACFRSAIAIAAAQQAKILELRATVSLAGLRHGDGRTGEAYALLSDAYARLDEGFTTADLRDAKVLLEELA